MIQPDEDGYVSVPVLTLHGETFVHLETVLANIKNAAAELGVDGDDIASTAHVDFMIGQIEAAEREQLRSRQKWFLLTAAWAVNFVFNLLLLWLLAAGVIPSTELIWPDVTASVGSVCLITGLLLGMAIDDRSVRRLVRKTAARAREQAGS